MDVQVVGDEAARLDLAEQCREAGGDGSDLGHQFRALQPRVLEEAERRIGFGRIRVTNLFNDNSDYFYVKQADASRIYGLELEHILSPNRINYLVNGNTLIEEHIAGVPGDVFLREYINQPGLNKVRVAKEFTKFSERSFIRLLGDMRSVNYVVDITPDFEEVQYRVLLPSALAFEVLGQDRLQPRRMGGSGSFVDVICCAVGHIADHRFIDGR